MSSDLHEVGGVLPTTLREQIVYELRHAEGPLLRQALYERCSMRVSETYFSGEFGRLVAEGVVKAAHGTGPRIAFQLADSPVLHMQDSGAASRLPTSRAGKLPSRHREQQIVQAVVTAAQPITSLEIATRIGMTSAAVSNYLPRLLMSGRLRKVGQNNKTRWAAPLAEGSAPANEGLTVRVKLTATGVRPFFKFLQQLKADGGVAA